MTPQPTSADTLARLDAWLAACDRALTDGADPVAVLVLMGTVAWECRLMCRPTPPGLTLDEWHDWHFGQSPVRVADLDATYQAPAWRTPHGCETP